MSALGNEWPRVFLSSRIKDDEIKPLRDGLKTFCTRGNIKLVSKDFETGAQTANPHDLSTDTIVTCQILVLIVGKEGIGPITKAEWQAWRSSGRLASGCKELVYYTKSLGFDRMSQIFNDVFPSGQEPITTWSELDAEPHNASAQISSDVQRDIREFESSNPTEKLGFAQEISDYYQAKGWITQNIQPVVPGQSWFIASNNDIRELIYCCEDQVSADDVRNADRLAIERNATHFLLITEEPFPDTLRDTKTRTKNKRLRLVNSFLLELLNIENDIKEIENEAQKDDLANRFVDAGCQQCTPDEYLNEVEYDPHDSALKYAKDWVKRTSRTQLAVLGDFGTGKSWLARRLCLHLCENIRKRKPGRLPLFVPFSSIPVAEQKQATGEVGSAPQQLQLKQHIASLVSDEHNSNPLLNILLRSGRLLLVLDGFDELGTGMDDRVKESHLAEILSLTTGQGGLKIILTSRREFFDSAISESRILGKAGARGASLRFDIVKLAEFSPSHIQDLLLKRLRNDHARADNYYKRIKATPGLEALVSRPIVLDMALEILRKESETKRLTLYDIYSHCTSNWLKGIGKEDAELDGDLRLELTCDLAWHMYIKNLDEVDSQTLARLISSIRKLGAWIKDMDRLLRSKMSPSARTETFLVRTGEGSFAFAHRSFMEYFVARKLLSEMEAKRPALFGAKHISDGTASFLLSHGVDTELLAEWLRDAGSGDWLAGNILTLLRGSKVDLRGMDLSGLLIKKANLQNTDLQGVSFRGATLDGVMLSGADLSNSDCRDAKLEDLMLGVKSSAKTISCSPTGSLVASANGENEIVLIDLDSDAPPIVLGKHEDSVTCVRFSESGKHLASIGFDKQLIVWDIEKRQPFQVFQVETGSPYAAAIMDEYDVVMAAGLDTIVYAWTLGDRHNLGSRKKHSKAVYCIATCTAEDPVTGSKRGLFATASFDHSVAVWNLTDSKVGFRVPKVITLHEHDSLVNGVAFTPDGLQVISCDNNGKLVVHRYADNNWEFDLEISAHKSQIWCVQVSPDGQLAATSSTDGTIAVWSTADWTEKMRLKGHESAIWGVDFDAHSSRLVSCSLDATIRVWDLQKQAETRKIPVGTPRDPGFSCRGMKLAGSEGLSGLQKMLLLKLGAIDIDEGKQDRAT